MLVAMFIPTGPIIMGVLRVERRKGQKIKAGIYRDPMRSSHSHFVKVSGLRWLSMMLLVEIPAQIQRYLSRALAPSERYSQQYKLRHKKLIDWARQMMFQAKRWLPTRELVVVADSSFARSNFCSRAAVMPIHIITGCYGMLHYTRLHHQDCLVQWDDLASKGKTKSGKVPKHSMGKNHTQPLVWRKRTHS